MHHCHRIEAIRADGTVQWTPFSRPNGAELKLQLCGSGSIRRGGNNRRAAIVLGGSNMLVEPRFLLFGPLFFSSNC